MRGVCLLGARGHKRSVYFDRAAASCGLTYTFSDWDGGKESPPGQRLLPLRGDLLVKIDPPVTGETALGSLDRLAEEYEEKLAGLKKEAEERAALGYRTSWLNTPGAILTALDKKRCSGALSRAGIPSTGDGLKESRAVLENLRTGEELLCWMEESGERQVFVKPARGSGAAGVCALRFRARTGEAVLYTCAAAGQGGTVLVNTKKLYTVRNLAEIRRILNLLFTCGCLVERWYPKPVWKGYSYDLRAVWQFGRLDYLLARLSKGPITNLQLNNRPMDAGSLGLSPGTVEEIEELCRRAAAAVPGLASFGADILPGRGEEGAKVIEINGQGDLIYQDIYGENRIYKSQAERMKRFLLSGE